MSSIHHGRRVAALMVATAAALSLAAASAHGSEISSSTASFSHAAPSPAPGAAQITMKNFAFSPASLTVKAGQKVTVVNDDSDAHTVTATQAGAFDTGSIAGGKSGSFTAPSKKGTYSFICTFHPYMKGTLTVS